MAKKIFINLPVAELAPSMSFYSKLGFTNNPTFTDDTGACMVLSEEIYVMLLTRTKFKEFVTKPIANAAETVAVINALSVDSPEEVNTIADAAIKAGGKESLEPKDYGFMQQRSFSDIDGHQWEVFYMDMSKFPKQ
jgi:uncharacterized protein